MELSQYSFLNGFVIDRQKIYLVGVEDAKAMQGIQHSVIVFFFNEKWQNLELEENLVSMTFSTLPEKKLVAISENGRAIVSGGGKVISEYIFKGLPSPHGLLTEVRAIAKGHAYAVGSGRVVYRKEGLDNWSRIDQTCKPKSREKMADVGFFSIDGFAEDDIYAVGWNGEIWHYNGEKWQRKDSPTNVTLFKVLCCEDGNVYACGQLGRIVKGRDDSWEVITQDETEETLRGLAYFKGELYISTTQFIYKIGKKGFEQVIFDYNAITCAQLYATEDLMLSVGAKDVYLYDGEDWEKII